MAGKVRNLPAISLFGLASSTQVLRTFIITNLHHKMHVTRKAILIGCPGKGGEFLPAVSCDLENYKNFLLSDRGGRWFENEIEIFYDYRSKDVFSLVQSAIADYTIVYFSGHGFADRRRRNFLSFKDGNIEDVNFLNESPRQKIIVDACRKIPLHSISGIPQRDPRFLRADGFYPAREMFNRFILSSPVGKIIIHATDHDTEAQSFFTGSDGSVFTQCLINTARHIRTKNYHPLSDQEVLNLVSEKLSKNIDVQIPEITYSEGMLSVPFSLGFINPPQKIQLPVNSNQKAKIFQPYSSIDGWSLFGVGVLVIAAIASVKRA